MSEKETKRTIPVHTAEGDGFVTPEAYQRLKEGGLLGEITPEVKENITQQAIAARTKRLVSEDPTTRALVAAKGALDAVNPLSLFGLSGENVAYGLTRLTEGQEAASALRQNVELGQAANPWEYGLGSAAGVLGPGIAGKVLGAGSKLGGVAKATDELMMAPITGLTTSAGTKIPGIWDGISSLSKLGAGATPEMALAGAKSVEGMAATAGLGSVAKQAARFGTEMAAFGAGQEFNHQLGAVIAERDGQLDGAKLLAAAGKGALGGALFGGAVGLGGLALSKIGKGAAGKDPMGHAVEEIGGAEGRKSLDQWKQSGETGATFEAIQQAGKDTGGLHNITKEGGAQRMLDASREVLKSKTAGLESIAKDVGHVPVISVMDDLAKVHSEVRAASVGSDVSPMFSNEMGNALKRAKVVAPEEAAAAGKLFAENKIQPYLRGEKNIEQVADDVARFDARAAALEPQFKQQFASIEAGHKAALEKIEQEFSPKLSTAKYNMSEEIGQTADARRMHFDTWLERTGGDKKAFTSQRSEYIKNGTLPAGFDPSLVSGKARLDRDQVAFPLGNRKEGRTPAKSGNEALIAEKKAAIEQAGIARQAAIDALEADKAAKLAVPKEEAQRIAEARAEVEAIASLAKKKGVDGAKDFLKKLKDSTLSGDELYRFQNDIAALGGKTGDEFGKAASSALSSSIERSLGPEALAKWNGIKGQQRGAQNAVDFLEKNLSYRPRMSEGAKAKGFIAGGIAGAVAGGMSGSGTLGWLVSMGVGGAAREFFSKMDAQKVFWKADLAQSMESHSGVLRALQGADEKAQKVMSDAIFRTEKVVSQVVGGTPEGKKLDVPTKMFGDSLDTQRVEMGKFIKEIKDPEKAVMAYADKLGAMATVHPSAAMSMMNTAMRGIGFLGMVAPKGRKSAMSFTPFDVEDNTNYPLLEMQRFARYAETVTDPYSVFERIANGTLRTENIDAFKDVHKELYAFHKQQLMDMVTDAKQAARLEKISLQKKMQLAKLFDIPWFKFASPQMRMAFQASFSSAPAGSPPKSPPSGGGSSSQSSQSYETTLEMRNGP